MIFRFFTLRLSFLFICFTSVISVFGQGDRQRQKDSIRSTFAHLEGAEKIKSYSQLGFILAEETVDRESFDILMAFYKEFDEEAKKQKNMKVQDALKLNTLIVMLNMRMYDELIAKAPEYLKFFKENKAWDNYFTANRILFLVYIDTDRANKAIEGAEQLYQEAKELQNTKGMASACDIISVAYRNIGRLVETEEYLRKAIKLYKENDNCLSEQEQAQNDLCRLLIAQERFDEALKEAAALESVIQQWVNRANFEGSGTWKNLWRIYTELYIATGDYSKAEIYCDKLESLPVRLHGEVYRLKTLILMNQKKYEEALAMNDKDMELLSCRAEENNTRELRMMILAKMGRVEEALELYDVIIGVKDSLYDLQIDAQLDELRTQYEVEKHIAEKERNHNYFLFALGGCVLLAIALGIWINRNRTIVKKNRGLYRQIKEQDRLAEELEAMSKQYEEMSQSISSAPDVETRCIASLPGNNQQRQLVSRLREYLIKDKYFANYNIDIQKLVSEMATNRASFFEVLKVVTGKTPMEYINYLRLDEAKRLLDNSDLTIETIAMECGFNTANTFYRQFRERYRMTPTEYRKFNSLNV
jgi:AraC-like DNA-binding protein